MKVLEEVNDHGLERWRPVHEDASPSARPSAGRPEALAVEAPALDRETYRIDELVPGQTGSMRSVPVHKHRGALRDRRLRGGAHRRRGGGAASRTIAIESEDPAP